MLLTRCTLLASLSLPLVFSLVLVHSSCQVLNSSTVAKGFTQAQQFPTIVTFFLFFTHPGARSFQIVSHHLAVECGIHVQ